MIRSSCFTMTVLCAISPQTESAERPNIVLLFADDAVSQTLSHQLSRPTMAYRKK